MNKIILFMGLSFLAGSAFGQAAKTVRRVDLQRQDISIPGHEALQVRVDFDPGVVAPAHRHPGEEIIYVLAGELEYMVAGKTTTLKAGGVLLSPPEWCIPRKIPVACWPASWRRTWLKRGSPLSYWRNKPRPCRCRRIASTCD